MTDRKIPSLVSGILAGKNRPPDRTCVVGDAPVLDREGEFALLHPVAAPSDRAGGAVARTMAVLRALIRLGPGEHALASIAESAALPAATAHRYLQAMVREGAVEQRGPRARYALVDALHGAPHSISKSQPSPAGQPSPAVRAELVTLQSRTGQIAFVYRPYLIGTPMRICADRAYGAHGETLFKEPREALQALESAPLDADPAGKAILACLGAPIGSKIDISRIREEGHALGSSPLPGRSMIAAPVWYGSTVAGSVALLAGDAQMKRAATRARYVDAVMDAAAAMSGRLTRSGARRAS
ncbi:helix-turn-helix domain-containing protein [Streptomyces sp. NPDC047072]|uniref:helix-turn-helix domain-containing protein n=1 Tax=Streptomyces sp. NPDC047072 TaxID=3154809 RepID=UPI0033CFD0E3